MAFTPTGNCINSSGSISASDINQAFGRSSTANFSIYSARNGSYGAINNASGFRPTANGQSGYAWSHWRGYCHTVLMPLIYTFLYEPSVGINIRYYVYDAYGNNIISEFWYYTNTSFANLASDTGATIRTNNSVQILFSPDYWGSGSIYKQVYSLSAGYLLNVYEDAYSSRIFTFTTGGFTGDSTNSHYWVNAGPGSI